MDKGLPLFALLSQALVAFTIEFDNEAEQRLPHRTTRHGRTPGSLRAPWLVSMVMWLNCMRFVDDTGVTVRELERLARTKTNLPGMQRWGYIVVKPDPADKRTKPPHSEWVIRPTEGGRTAQGVWLPLFGAIEDRWQERFGTGRVKELREALLAVVSELNPGLPDCLPLLGYGLFSGRAKLVSGAAGSSDLTLPELFSKVLLAFAIEFESQAAVSLAISANVLRLGGADEIRVRDLPDLAGVSKEAIAVALSYLTKRGYAAVTAESGGSRTKLFELTAKGRGARETYYELVSTVEEQWTRRFGKKLREALEPLVGDLFQRLKPYPSGWRAAVPRPKTLPHYPMITHRGGFPDGS